MIKKIFFCLQCIFFLSAFSASSSAKNPEFVVMKLKYGEVVIKLRPDLAPKHVARIKELINEEFYDGLTFHRAIENLIVQTGDPQGNGTGGSGQTLHAEFSNAKHTRGAVSMARSNQINSADSQFFIVLKDTPAYDQKYTIWGYVVKGMDAVDQIKKGETWANGMVINPDTILSMRMKK